MDSDWHDEVTSTQREKLIADLIVELHRISGDQDAQKVRDSAAKFELMVWSHSVDHVSYLTKMTRKLAKLRAKPSKQVALGVAESDWREEVASDQREKLISDLIVELHRISGEHDAQRVRGSVAKFELMVWSNSVDSATYLAKMTRKLAQLKAKPSSEKVTESQHSTVTPLDFSLDGSAADGAAADPAYTARLQGMKSKYMDALTLIAEGLKREAAQQWASDELRAEISRLEVTVGRIITLLEATGDDNDSRVAVDRTEDYIQRYLLPIRQVLGETKAEGQLEGALQTKSDEQTRRLDEVHVQQRQAQVDQQHEEREKLLQELEQESVPAEQRDARCKQLDQQHQIAVFRLQRLHEGQRSMIEQKLKAYVQQKLSVERQRPLLMLLRVALTAAGWAMSLPQQQLQQQQQRQSGQQAAQAAAQAPQSSIPVHQSVDVPMAANIPRPLEMPDGFLAAPATHGVWSEPALVAHRINSSELTPSHQLSSGNFGELWVGTLRGQRVAIKRLTSGGQNKANSLAFASEIKLMTQLQHPKITAFLGVEWNKEWQAQAVTAFIPGGDLRSLLDTQQQQKSEWFTWADFKCQTAIDVVDALAYLHSRNEPVCMQTLKARHVLLDAETASVANYNGGAKLSLYAVARSRSILSNIGADESSLRWLAPELATGDATWTDRATIYSFGVMLSELDTTRVPYYDAANPDGSAMSSFKVLQLVSNGQLQVSLSEDCPEAIAMVVRQCTASDPLQRPSATQLAFTLRDILKNEL